MPDLADPAPAVVAPRALPSDALLARIQGPGPRYTSYPTADRFGDFDEHGVERLLAARRADPAAGPLSVYVHVPFCESVCYYCACNKIITKHHERGLPYVRALVRELGLVAARLGPRRTVTQLHFGGGSPTFLSDHELARLMATLRRVLDVTPDAEISIEVDPRTVTPQRLAHLRAQGFNRLSFGVQDFDPDVQQAVHRVQSFESVRDLMAAARALGYRSINVDLIYGLPRQTAASFARTIAQVAGLRPDRIALYAYAHLPERFKPQRRIHADELPGGPARVAMLGTAMAGFQAEGYAYIGMDHFALPDDSLAVAQREGRLQRNFQGYSTQPDCDLVALGVSAIGRIGDGYYQNAKTLPEYEEALARRRLPVVRGLVLDADDQVRRHMIMTLMCTGRLDFDEVARRFGVDVRSAYDAELTRLAPLCADGFVRLHESAVEVTALGWYVVRAVAMVFDRHLGQGVERVRFSRLV